MNEHERKLQQQRIDKFEALVRVEHEVLTAIKQLEPDSDGAFTGNASRIKPVVGITIHLATTEGERVVELKFTHLRALSGWRVSNALTPLLVEVRDQIWREKEKI